MVTKSMEHFFNTREDASMAAANAIATRVGARLDMQPGASLVVSGGTSPTRCFEELSSKMLDWHRTHVVLSDERWVPPDDEASNERLVRESLLRGSALPARLLSVFSMSTSIEDRCIEIDQQIRKGPFPFACVLLGMGEDGHFASLFPDAENLDEGLDVEGEQLCIPVTTAASPHPRVSLTLAALARSDAIVLLMFGDNKREVYEQAKRKGSKLPVAHLIKQKKAPVHVYWAP
ncbi:MAG: 6-phosphogluconolactonase [Woeseiaceae bacterium]|nr:6-phosphogluconolactonase [Woeseiaceae bacterium]